MIGKYQLNFLVQNNQVWISSKERYFIFISFIIAADYNIEIQTGSEQIQPLDSPVYMQIFGTITTTPKLFLESKYASFTKDSIAKFNISSNNVGEVKNNYKNFLFDFEFFFRFKKSLLDMKILVQLMIGIYKI